VADYRVVRLSRPCLSLCWRRAVDKPAAAIRICKIRLFLRNVQCSITGSVTDYRIKKGFYEKRSTLQFIDYRWLRGSYGNVSHRKQLYQNHAARAESDGGLFAADQYQ